MRIQERVANAAVVVLAVFIMAMFAIGCFSAVTFGLNRLFPATTWHEAPAPVVIAERWTATTIYDSGFNTLTQHRDTQTGACIIVYAGYNRGGIVRLEPEECQ